MHGVEARCVCEKVREAREYSQELGEVREGQANQWPPDLDIFCRLQCPAGGLRTWWRREWVLESNFWFKSQLYLLT